MQRVAARISLAVFSSSNRGRLAQLEVLHFIKPLLGSLAEFRFCLAVAGHDFAKLSAGNFFAPLQSLAVFHHDVLPLLEGLLQFHAGRRQGSREFLDGFDGTPQETPLALGNHGLDDFFVRNGAQIRGQPYLIQQPDRPFGGIELPFANSIAVVVLKFVVVVVVAFAEGADRHEETIAGGAGAGVGTAADPVAQRIDAKGHVMHDHNAGHTSQEEGTQGSSPGAQEITQDRRQKKTHGTSDPNVVLVLETQCPILLQIPHPGERGIRTVAEEQPPDVRMEKSLVDIVGIFFLIHMFVVTAVVRTPDHGGAFKGGGTKEQGEPLDCRMAFEGEVGKKAVIAQCDAHAGGYEKK